jgi:hypothetical protein
MHFVAQEQKARRTDFVSLLNSGTVILEIRRSRKHVLVLGLTE